MISAALTQLAGAQDVQPQTVQAAIDRAERAVKQADEAWKKSVTVAKERLVQELLKAKAAAERKQQDDAVKVIDDLLVKTEQEIRLIKAATSLSSGLTEGKLLTPAVEMYDVMKPAESDKFAPGDDGGLSFSESTLRPKKPMEAYRRLKKGMTKKEVLELLGGYQSSDERDNTLVISWVFGGGMASTVTVTFVDGKVVSFARLAS
jgi:hypothetical protein